MGREAVNVNDVGSEADRGEFRGGPLKDGRSGEVHSLVVHMRGDGRYSIGWYERIESGVFEWRASALPPEDRP